MRHHLWLGLGLLLGLLVLALVLNCILAQGVHETRTHLHRAEEAASRGEADLSGRCVQNAQKAWETAERILGYFVAQEKLDTITREIELLLLTDPAEEPAAYVRGCRAIVLELRVLVEGEGLRGQNLLAGVL
ncbi:MAG: DUF4363 family protein [Ruminococcaceae bacterium]|nr:DUF4363 family protein [Oscillospiraceae bacterium]